ncbi:protein sevenless-like [Formica exsecta]|uniref:protein sevenless-like n=1 Tax=Formica exsecta TaxID=72781 RepID=UPI00114177B3|nr:protein sevenless-like [Formica exsecta]
MSETVYILLKVLILAKADILSKHPDSDFIQDISVSENNDYHILQNFKFDRSHPKSVSVRNKIDEITFANMSVIRKPNKENILSKPTCPRAFVEFYNRFLSKEDDISVTFRWNKPEFTDEVIQGYTVQCWFIENLKKIQICDNKNVVLECTVHNLKPNTTYYFQVRAHTKVGAGLYTDLIDVSTTHENPIPQLLMITRNAEHKIYWTNKERELMILEMSEKYITKIAKLQFVVHYLCIDWVARNLYWTEFDGNESYYIVKLDLTMWKMA